LSSGVSFERDERLRTLERERQIRQRLHAERVRQSGVRVGHARVAPVRPSLLARLVLAVRGRPATPGHLTPTGSPAGVTSMIGCRA
jgi:hypothetical protein